MLSARMFLRNSAKYEIGTTIGRIGHRMVRARAAGHLCRGAVCLSRATLERALLPSRPANQSRSYILGCSTTYDM